MGGKIRIVNSISKLYFIRKNNHLCQFYLTADFDTNSIRELQLNLGIVKTIKEGPPTLHSEAVSLDPDKVLREGEQKWFRDSFATYDSVFNPKIWRL